MYTVLIIEDYELNTRLVEDLLQLGDEQYYVLSAFNAEDGLELAYQYHPDLILMDLRIAGPGIDGWTAIRHVKHTPELAHIPIIALTASVNAIDRREAFDAGCDAYITKPFDIRELRTAISDHVHHVRA